MQDGHFDCAQEHPSADSMATTSAHSLGRFTAENMDIRMAMACANLRPIVDMLYGSKTWDNMIKAGIDLPMIEQKILEAEVQSTLNIQKMEASNELKR